MTKGETTFLGFIFRCHFRISFLCIDNSKMKSKKICFHIVWGSLVKINLMKCHRTFMLKQY